MQVEQHASHHGIYPLKDVMQRSHELDLPRTSGLRETAGRRLRALLQLVTLTAACSAPQPDLILGRIPEEVLGRVPEEVTTSQVTLSALSSDAVSADFDGQHLVVAWIESGLIHLRIFDASLHPITESAVLWPAGDVAVAWDATGIAALWTDASNALGDGHVYFVRLDDVFADPTRDEESLQDLTPAGQSGNELGLVWQPGGYLATWQGFVAGMRFYSMIAPLDAQGMAIGVSHPINYGDSLTPPQATPLDGDWGVVWVNDEAGASRGWGLIYARLAIDGSVTVPATLVNADDSMAAESAAVSSDGLATAIVYSNRRGELFFVGTDLDGGNVTGDLLIADHASRELAIEASEGSFAVAWRGPESGLYVLGLDVDGTPLGRLEVTPDLAGASFALQALPDAWLLVWSSSAGVRISRLR